MPTRPPSGKSSKGLRLPPLLADELSEASTPGSLNKVTLAPTLGGQGYRKAPEECGELQGLAGGTAASEALLSAASIRSASR